MFRTNQHCLEWIWTGRETNVFVGFWVCAEPQNNIRNYVVNDKLPKMLTSAWQVSLFEIKVQQRICKRRPSRIQEPLKATPYTHNRGSFIRQYTKLKLIVNDHHREPSMYEVWISIVVFIINNSALKFTPMNPCHAIIVPVAGGTLRVAQMWKAWLKIRPRVY